MSFVHAVTASLADFFIKPKVKRVSRRIHIMPWVYLRHCASTASNDTAVAIVVEFEREFVLGAYSQWSNQYPGTTAIPTYPYVLISQYPV